MSNSVGGNDNFRAKARKLSVLPTLLDMTTLYKYSLFIS